MAQISEGEQILIQQIRAGTQEAWAQLVERYEGRLLAFVRSRSIRGADAEDLVQETFLQFLRGLGSYRQEASLETWLFTILRRRIIDFARGRRMNACAIGDRAEDDSSASAPIDAAAPDLTASAYARRDERLDAEREALTQALRELIDELKERENFRDLKIVEMLFYAQMRNKEIAPLAGMDENNIALIKHRWLKSLREKVANRLAGVDVSGIEEESAADSLLTEIWEEERLSCPKRSTVGGYLLNTLSAAWQDYVDFHLQRLGCRSCRANLEDLQAQTVEAPRQLRDRIMQSTVGFFRKA